MQYTSDELFGLLLLLPTLFLLWRVDRNLNKVRNPIGHLEWLFLVGLVACLQIEFPGKEVIWMVVRLCAWNFLWWLLLIYLKKNFPKPPQEEPRNS
jgi:hypothetical protein